MAIINEKSEKELQKELFEKKEAARVFRFSTAGSKSRNVKEGHTLRRESARILTEINRRRKEK